VLVDGSARVSCVTAVRRVAGRDVRTVDGLEPGAREALVEAFTARGASQCGFCTPGIICRLAAIGPGGPSAGWAAPVVESALLAHLCRCTGWRPIIDAATSSTPAATPSPGAAERARIEGGSTQAVGPDTVLGRGGFADDTAPEGCLVAVPIAGADVSNVDGWATGETLAEARVAAGKVQGRRSGGILTHPVELPPGEWALTLRTTWVEPAYLEPDASWCLPGGDPADPAANGGDFGAKTSSPAPAAARLLADHYGRAVKVLFSREDTVLLGPKRPPVAAGIGADGRGILRLGLTRPAEVPPAWADVAPGLAIETVGIQGPPTSMQVRAAGWAEAAVLAAAARAVAAGENGAVVQTAEGASVRAAVEFGADRWPSSVHLEVEAGDPLDETVLRSYLTGAAHMALGWVLSEGIAVGPDGVVEDLTVRSFGILRARDTPPVDIDLRPGGGPPVRASDAAFAAVAAAVWLGQGLPSQWPTTRGARR
jgi:hypothetical protein